MGSVHSFPVILPVLSSLSLTRSLQGSLSEVESYRGTEQNGRIKMDWSVSLGTLIHLVLLVGSIVGLYVSISARIVALETKMDFVVREVMTLEENKAR